MKRLYFASLCVLCFTACSEEAQPYKETNKTEVAPIEKGYIQTH